MRWCGDDDELSGLLDTGMTPILLGSVIIISEAGLHRCTGGVAFRKVTDWRMLKMCVSALKSAGWDLLKFQQVKKNTLYVYFITSHGVGRNIVPAHMTGRDDEDVRKCLEINRLELSQI